MLLSANYDASRIVDTREAAGLVSELDHGRSPPATAEHRMLVGIRWRTGVRGQVVT